MPRQDIDSPDLDDQDRAESFDEATLDDELGEFRAFEELPDVYDATRALGDRDDDEALALDAGEFDERSFDQDTLEADDEDLEFLSADENDLADEQQGFDEDAIDDDDTIEGLDEVADAGLVTGGEDDFTNFQSKGLTDEDIERMGYGARDKE